MKLVGYILAVLLMWTQPAFAQTPSWVVTDAGGAAEVRRDGSVQPLRRGLQLQPGDVISTGANGRVSLGRGREFIVVSPASRLSIPTAAQQDGGRTQIFQHLGRALYDIERRATPHFGVRTPHVVAVVRGTTFTVSVDEEKGCRVAVSEGRVEVSSHDGRISRLVDPGMQATAPANDHSRIILERADPEESGTHG